MRIIDSMHDKSKFLKFIVLIVKHVLKNYLEVIVMFTDNSTVVLWSKTNPKYLLAI